MRIFNEQYFFNNERELLHSFTDSFSGLIAMSGSILSHFAIDKDPSETARYIARKNGCPTNDTRKMVYCLRELPVDKLIRVDSELENIRAAARGFVSSLSSLLGSGPVIEGSDDERYNKIRREKFFIFLLIYTHLLS